MSKRILTINVVVLPSCLRLQHKSFFFVLINICGMGSYGISKIKPWLPYFHVNIYVHILGTHNIMKNVITRKKDRSWWCCLASSELLQKKNMTKINYELLLNLVIQLYCMLVYTAVPLHYRNEIFTWWNNFFTRNFLFQCSEY